MMLRELNDNLAHLVIGGTPILSILLAAAIVLPQQNYLQREGNGELRRPLIHHLSQTTHSVHKKVV